MFNSRLVRKQDAALHFDVMSYLIRQFGPPPRPKVPSPLKKSAGFETHVWQDSDMHSIYDWAEAQLKLIQTDCHMNLYNVDLVPAGDGLNTNEIAAARRLDVLAAGQMPYRKTKFFHILYDPRDCAEPGHLTATITLKLAELRLSGFKPETDFTDDMKRKAALTAAIYNRQGFVLANLPDHVSTYLSPRHAARAIPNRFSINTLCFATCLALRVRRQTAEHIIGTYGTRMTLSLRSKIHQACRQIDMNKEALEVLQMLAEKKVRPQKLIQSA